MAWHWAWASCLCLGILYPIFTDLNWSKPGFFRPTIFNKFVNLAVNDLCGNIFDLQTVNSVGAKFHGISADIQNLCDALSCILVCNPTGLNEKEFLWMTIVLHFVEWEAGHMKHATSHTLNDTQRFVRRAFVPPLISDAVLSESSSLRPNN